MKKQIRRGVFETNSSSMHSLSIHRMGIYTPIKYDDIQDDDNMLHIEFGEFGWGLGWSCLKHIKRVKNNG